MGAQKTGNNTKPLALIIDDEEAICDVLAGVLEDEGWLARKALSGRQGLDEFQAMRPDLVFLDIWMPGIDGIETLQLLRDVDVEIPIVVMSGHGTIETAVKVTKLGAFDFLEKPLSLDKLLPVIEHAANIRSRRGAGDELATRPLKYELIGESQAIREIRKQIKIVAPRNAWVLITGENGTGKEVVAMNIHAQSSRANKPFVAVNCASLSETLIEKELFGQVADAFSGAVTEQRGKFELAHTGTLFLDGIGDMNLRAQGKVLRVLQEQEFERLGDDKSIQVDVRVVAATNKNLEDEIRKGSFREDLFYRLNVVPFHLPNLRERDQDVLILADYFLTKFAIEHSQQKKTLSCEAADILKNYHFPGNVRELRNLCQRLCALASGPVIRADELPDNLLL